MMKLHIIQARFGDCLLLEYGQPGQPAFMLIDGGPAGTYDNHLKIALQQIMQGHTQLEDLVVSHVDNDHIVGVLDLLTDLQKQKDRKQTLYLSPGELWFNSFSRTISTTDVEDRLGHIQKTASINGVAMQSMSVAVNGIREGSRVLARAAKLEIPVNKAAPGGFFLAEKGNEVIRRQNLEIWVAGPTRSNLEKLRAEWEEWIRKNELAIADGKYTRDVAAALDRSIPNLSSIVLLVKGEGKSILLTGDCRGDHLVESLRETGLGPDGKLHVDILKVPHHGSIRNAPPYFFEQVTANIYVISADGTYGNPDLETLLLIVDAAHRADRRIKLVVTNPTDTVTQLQQERPAGEYGYTVECLAQGRSWMTIG